MCWALVTRLRLKAAALEFFKCVRKNAPEGRGIPTWPTMSRCQVGPSVSLAEALSSRANETEAKTYTQSDTNKATRKSHNKSQPKRIMQRLP